MKLDVILPTYNRERLLRRALRSLRDAAKPEELDVAVTVVDNNSTDGTRAMVQAEIADFPVELTYLFEARPGKSHALNSAIASTDGDLVGMIDDDEEVDAGWFRCIAREFAEPATDFIGGPYRPRWGAPPPDWLPDGYRAAIGWVDGGDEVAVYGGGYEGMLMGGNAVIRREAIERAGPYATHLGRIGNGLLASEDEDMYERLLGAGARGLYIPDLIIYHFIPPERMTRRYYRRWAFWRAVSQGMLDRDRPANVAYLTGIPRHLFGSAARAALRTTTAALPGGGAKDFTDQLEVCTLAGFFYGKHLYRRGGHRPPLSRTAGSVKSSPVPVSRGA